MTPDIERVCQKCSRTFWVTAEEQASSRQQKLDHCPECRRAKASAEMSSALASLEQLKEVGEDKLVAKILPDPTKLFADVKQLAGQASAPIHIRPRTFLEWIGGVDILAEQVEAKLKAGEYADLILVERLKLIRHYLEVARTMHEVKHTALQQHQDELRAYLETLKVEEEIARQQALRDDRIKTRRLEEELQQAKLLKQIDPPPPPIAPIPEDPSTSFVREYRKEMQTRAEAKQAVISDFLNEIRQVFEAELDDSEKVIRIRAVLDTYKQDFEALPADIRKFVERVENGESEAPETSTREERDRRYFVETVHEIYASNECDRTEKAVCIRALVAAYHRRLDALTPEMRDLVEDSEQQFRREATAIYSSNLADAEKLLRIRALLKTYCHHVGALPEEVRRFAERTEDSA